MRAKIATCRPECNHNLHTQVPRAATHEESMCVKFNKEPVSRTSRGDLGDEKLLGEMKVQLIVLIDPY